MQPLYGAKPNAWYRIGRMAMIATIAGALLVIAAAIVGG